MRVDRLGFSIPIFLAAGLSIFGCGADNPVAHQTDPEITTVFEVVSILGAASIAPFSLALDANGFPHIAYIVTDSKSVSYVYYSGSGWIAETAAESTDKLRGISLIIDPLGNPLVVYQNSLGNSTSEFWLARRHETGWTAEIVDADGSPGWQSSLAFDDSGNLHIAYFSGYPDYDLRYARFDNGTWNTTVVDAEGSTGYDPSLVFDTSRNPAIAYGDVGGDRLRLARFLNAQWKLETIDTEPAIGSHLSMGADEFARLHIAYRGGTKNNNGTLKYAFSAGAVWDIRNVDAAGDVGYYPSVAIARSGKPWIAYCVGGVLRVSFAEGNTWRGQDIEALGINGYPELRRDRAGRLGLAYFNRESLSIYFSWLFIN